MLLAIRQDVTYGLRSLRQRPVFTFLAVLVLALGIGSATTIFSVIQSVLLKPLPYTDADRIVGFRIYNATGRGSRSALSVPEFLDYQAGVSSFEEVIAEGTEDVLYTTAEGAQQFAGGLVSANTFRFLGVPAVVGRTVTPHDAAPGAPRVFVMSHRMWARQFALDRSIVGRQFVLNGWPTTLVGIMPARFKLLNADLYRPVNLSHVGPEDYQNRYVLRARLRRGRSLSEAEAEIGALALRLASVYPKSYPEKFTVKVVRWADSLVGQFRRMLYVLAAAVALLLLIACSNVANLLLARGVDRRTEMAIRSSLGASRARLVRQLLLESLLLASIGAFAGCVLAFVGIRALVAAMPNDLIPGEVVIQMNLPALLFSLITAVFAALVSGLAPAMWTARPDLGESLRDVTKGAGGRSSCGRLSGTLAIAEVAFSLMILAGAGLLVRGFVKLRTAELGFDPENVLVVRLVLPPGQHDNREAKQHLLERVLSRVGSLRGVIAASTGSFLPLYGGFRSDVSIASRQPAEGQDALIQLCSEGYFSTMKQRLIRGRTFSEAEVRDASRVAIVNDTLARQYFGNKDPIGRTIKLSGLESLRESPVANAVFQIVGVAADAKNWGIQDNPVPEVFLPYTVNRRIRSWATGPHGTGLDSHAEQCGA